MTQFITIPLFTLSLTLGLSLNLISCRALKEPDQTPVSLTPTEKVATDSSTVQERGRYSAIDLNQLSPDLSLTGSEPKALALAAFGTGEAREQEGAFQETVSVNTNNPQRVIVTITYTGLLDDSVHGIRYRVDFEPITSSSGKSQSQMVWAGQQYTCQPGRGATNWTRELCS